MKKTLIIISILIVLNLLALPTLLNVKNNNHELDQTLEQVPNNTIYVSTSTSISNEIGIEQMEKQFNELEGFKKLEKNEIQDFTSILYSGLIHNQNNNNFKDSVSIPLINLVNPQDQQFEIVSGRNLTTDSDEEIVISSSFANHVSDDIDSLINTYIGNYKIVGIYNDPIPYVETNRFNMPLFPIITEHVDLQSPNVAYISSATYLDENEGGTYEVVDNVENIVHYYMYKLTFDNDDLNTNTEAIESIIGDQGVILSKQGVDDTDYYTGFYTSANRYYITIRNCLVFIDILVLILVIALNRKESNA